MGGMKMLNLILSVSGPCEIALTDERSSETVDGQRVQVQRTLISRLQLTAHIVPETENRDLIVTSQRQTSPSESSGFYTYSPQADRAQQ